jgi:hypothetical protein
MCHTDTLRLERALGDVAAIVRDLDVTISKQAKIGNASGPGGLARERSPLNWGAVSVADDLQNTLTSWARDVAPQWRANYPAAPSITASRILLFHIDAIRRHAAVNELVDEITDAVEQARRVVDRPADRVFLGACLAEFEGVTCTEDIYAKAGAGTATCKVCGVTHDVGERRAWLLEQAADRLFTVREAAQMMGSVGGIKVTEASIRGYVHRGRIAYHTTKLIRLGDLLAVVLGESERKSA